MASIVFSALCLSLLIGPAVSSSGLQFRLSPTNSDLPGTSFFCGVLLCEKSSLSEDEHRNITGMSLYKAVSHGPTDSGSTKSGNLSRLAFLSPSQPSLEENSNGVKVSGSLKTGQASLRVELSKQTDCLTEYTCEVQEVDSEGKELITLYRLLQARDQNSDNKLNEDLTSSSLTRFLSLAEGLDIKLTTNEMYLKDKLSLVEDRTFDLQKQITDKPHQKIAAMEKSFERIEAKVETILSAVETRLNLVENSLEQKVADLQNQLTDKIYSLESHLQNEAYTNFKHIEEKLCDLETRLASVDREAIQQKVLNTVKDQVDAHFLQVLDATDKADETLNNTANLLTALKLDNTHFQIDVINTYGNFLYNVTRGMNKVFLHNENLTNIIKKSLHFFNNDLLLSLDRVESTTDNSVDETSTSLQALEAELKSSIAGEIESSLVDFFMPETCEKNTPVLLKTASTPYPVIYKSDILGLDTPILCDTRTDEGGWIVIQRRSTGDVDFYRDWVTYKKGFGALHTDFWLGLENIHAITSSGKYELRVDLKFQGQSKYAVYNRFSLTGETKNYTITLGSYSGTAGDSLSYHNGMQFSTRDRDNDIGSWHCAQRRDGAWWYNSCQRSNLNGRWQALDHHGPRWELFTDTDPASFTEMKIRRLED
ncbi:ficolin-1 [Elysia marginata]|uniref:Ficolin-1 n=1 Tax=Elysia marginata TaxID=1093978 RepID=A0AAV4I502_9GAST|nr:ficolin-1 [Elysia marginata]